MKHQIAAIFLLSAATAGCAVVQEKTIGESLDDASASSQVKGLLMKASAQGFAEVDVEVTGGLVLLTGRVASEQEKVEADKIAWSVRNIGEVANEIQVIADSSVLNNVNDEWITAQVRSRLFGDAAIKSVNYNIETFNGVVYLMGVARDQTELKRTAEHASLVRGVGRVVSYVKIRDISAPPEHSYSAQYERSRQPTATVPAPTPSAPVYNQAPQQPAYTDPLYGDNELVGGYGSAPLVEQEVPFVDPANPGDVYDENGYLIDRSSGAASSSQDSYEDPFSDPFGDSGSYN